MADIYVDMSGEDKSETKCRHARRRRIKIQRFETFPGQPSPCTVCPLRARKRLEVIKSEIPAVVDKPSRTNSTNTSSPTSTGFSTVASSLLFTPSSDDAAEHSVLMSSFGGTPAVNTVIAFGSVSLSGRSREMEDAISVQPGFFQFPGGCYPLHFFAVFDGHGGSHVSALCKETMHTFLAEELTAVPAPDEAVDSEDTTWRLAVERCFARMDQLALSACACGRTGEPRCLCERSGIESDIVGSTAVVAVVGGGRLLVANCGDSRAVLSRGGRTVPLSTDHKPDRPDELARIEAAGGRVIHVNGARVHGILAMSRALGDKYLKPVVISSPEIVISKITPEDECLIIASDGLWDVIPNELACNVARRCLSEGSPTSTGEGQSSGERDQPPKDWCSMAAALLARLALGRRSADNISVIVVDLRGGCR